MKKAILMPIICLLIIALGSCHAVESSSSETLYPSATYAEGDYIWCAVSSLPVNGIRYYNTLTDSVSSLCTDPLCNHLNDCPLLKLTVDSIIAEDSMIYANVRDMQNERCAIVRFDFQNQSRKDIITDTDNGLSDRWCIYGDDIYYLQRNEQNIRNIFKCNKQGGTPEQITDLTGSIEDFKVYNGDVFYALANILYRNGDPIFTIPDPIITFDYDIYDGYLYYTIGHEYIEYEEGGELDYNYVLAMNSRVDLYRMPLDTPHAEGELILENILNRLRFIDGSIYYQPFTGVDLAFRYKTDPDSDEYISIYNSYDSTLMRYEMKSGKSKTLFNDNDMLVNYIAALTDRYIIAYCVPYADAEWIDEEAREVDSYFYMDNADYYKLTYDGEIVGHVGFYKNNRGSIS